MNPRAAERIITVLSVIWIALVALLSAVLRDFDWFERYRPQSLGPATITAICGEIIIVAAVLGAPWVFEAFHKERHKDE